MSDNEYDEDGDYDEPKPKPNWRRKLEADAEAGRLAQAKAEQAERELAFYKAQIPMEAPGITYFVKGYDGELSADAIRKAATDAGFIKTQTDPAMTQELADQSAYTAAAGTAAPGDEKSRQAEALAAAKKAADAAPAYQAAQVYSDTLTALGYGRTVLPPS